MATPRSQRIVIWIIVFAIAVGTIGTYFALVLGNQNDSQAAVDQQKTIDEYYAQIKDQAKANQPIAGYEVTKFDPASVTELAQEDLIVGTGQDVKLNDKITVSYTGWTPDGTIFDSTTKTGTNTTTEFTLAEGSLITGWTNGIPGMKVGGVRKLTIPADQAYGATGSEPLIPANTPLQFIVRIDGISI